MDKLKENFQSGTGQPLPENLENIVTTNGSHQMTLTGYPKVKGADESQVFNSIEYHLTARLTKETLSFREMSLLLEVLEYQICYFGMNINQQICLYDLYFRILGNKRESKEIQDSNIRKTLLVAEIILKEFRGLSVSLSSRNFVELNPVVSGKLKKYLMSSRTYGSRHKTWRPEVFLEILAVPVDIQFVESKLQRPNRYSSYCKGYGESHPSTHRKRTMPSPELDGNGVSFVQAEEKFLFRRCTEPNHVLCEYLGIWYENEIERKT